MIGAPSGSADNLRLLPGKSLPRAAETRKPGFCRAVHGLVTLNGVLFGPSFWNWPSMAIDDPDISKRNLRAFIIDDNEHMRALLHRLLHRMAIESTEYADGSAALEVVETVMPDFILSDL